METAVWGLVGTIVGALASIGTTWLASRSSESIHQEKVREERVERASAFQRQNLLELQEALHDALRLVSRGHVEDRLAASRGEPWRAIKLAPELDEQIRLGYRKVAILVERVADDKLRSEIRDLMSQAFLLLDAPNEREAIDHAHTTNVMASEAMKSIGTVLRSHFQSTR